MRTSHRPLQTAVTLLTAWACLLPPPRADGGEWADSLWRGMSRSSSHQRARPPATPIDGCVERLAGEIDWLEKYIDSYGSIVAKHPDVWGQSRLMRHRVELEKTLVDELGKFQDLNNGSLRRSDQSFVGMALALQAASRGQSIPGSGQGLPTASAISLVTTGTASDDTPIFRSAPFANTGTAPFATFGLGENNAVSLEPRIHLDHLADYVKHLQELRRINEGDDNGDSPGYALNLVRIPVSILPGQYTQRGHGAEITVTADLVLGEDLLPITFRSLVINDLVDTIAPTLTFAVNDPASRHTAWQTVHREAIAERLASTAEDLAQARDAQARAEAEVTAAREHLAQLQASQAEQAAIAANARDRVVTVARKQVEDLLSTDEAKTITAAIRRYATDGSAARGEGSPVTRTAPGASDEPLTEDDVTAVTRRLVTEMLTPSTGGGVRDGARVAAAPPATTSSGVAWDLLGKAWESIADDNPDLVERSRSTYAAATQAAEAITSRIAQFESSRAASQASLDAAVAAIAAAEARQAATQASAANLGASLERLRARLTVVSPAVVPSTKSRRSRLPIPPSQLAEVGGLRQVSLLITETHDALRSHPANRPCIDYNDVCGLLVEESQAAYDMLSQPPLRGVWESLPAWNLAELVRTRRFNELERRRCELFSLLGGEPAGTPGTGVPCCNDTACHAQCNSITGVLAWAILVQSALLGERLVEDMREAASVQGHMTPPGGSWTGPFYGPDPSPAARAAFNDYVRLRRPIRIFALDPVVQEQNIEDLYSKQRELQIMMALATAGGRLNSQTASRYARRLQTDMATIALNKTAVAFSHGSDTFGWRFYPRVQSPPTRNNIAAFADTLVGSNSEKRDLAERRLEPGIRECTAIVVMPSFVPYVNFDVRTNWFSLTKPKDTEQSMRQTLQLSRSIKAMQSSAAQCAECAGAYRDGEVARLMRRVEQLDRELPLQSMLTQIPYENTSGGFELLTTGITDLAPELVGWYGAPGISATGETTLFLVGKGFSVLDTQVIAGGQLAGAELISRQVMRVTVPAGVKPIRRPSAADCACPPPPPAPCPPTPSAARRLRRGNAGTAQLVGVAAVEPLPAPAGNPLRAGAAAESILVPACPPATLVFNAPQPSDAAFACPDVYEDELDPGCGRDCVDGQFVDLHLATPYGVSGHLLVPYLAPPAAPPPGPCTLSIDPPAAIALTASRTGTGTWRVKEYFDATPDVIRINAPAGFVAPSLAEIRSTVREKESGAVIASFTTSAPHFNAGAGAYVLAGGELRNFVGDTSRPATDKTLRGAIKPYLDSIGARVPADNSGQIAGDMILTFELVSGQQVIPIDGAITVAIRYAAQPGDDR
jgi:hypothetical protein